MSLQLLTKNYRAGAAIAAFTIVKAGATDDDVLQAAAAADSSIGICEALPATAGDRVDIVVAGIADVRLGGPVTRGAFVTANANAAAVTAAPGERHIGYARTSGVAGDIVEVLIAPGRS
jgi:hypothetical protein